MAEFTGERVVPGEVDPNLWNEHFARYAYAAQFAQGRRIADLGSGTGYGTAELAKRAAFAVGVDVAPEAVAYARSQYTPHYMVASAEHVPLAAHSFDLVTAFEVIEHLHDWPQMLAEARRLLSDTGLFFVSTPNKSYYAESRAEHGANPFHVHEFEYAEFADALRAVFPHVALLLENHAEGVAITNPQQQEDHWQVMTEAAARAEHAHFYLAVASASPLPPLPSFVYLPTTANLLQEREHHIVKLAGEIGKKDRWISEYTNERDKLLTEHHEMIAIHQRQQEEMEQQARWTQQVNADLAATQNRVVQLQEEMTAEQRAAKAMAEGYEQKIASLEQESARASQWAVETEQRLTEQLRQQQADLSAKLDELAKCVEYLHAAERDLEERNAWAESLQAESNKLSGELERSTAIIDFVRSSRWVKLGRRLGIGPSL